MLHDLETLIGSSVIATDGEIGSVRNFLFDDQSWAIRYVVVEVASWLKRRPVVLAITAVEQPDWAKKTFRVRLTKEQVRKSPDIDAEKPISRQQEIAMKEYFGWLCDWDDCEFPFLSSIPPGGEYPAHTKRASHLHRVWDLTGYEVWATNGEIGRLAGLLVDDGSWHVVYLNVKAGDWLPSMSVLLPARRVESISWVHRRVNLHHAREQI